MASEGFTSHRKDEETMRLEILTNIGRMMVNRGRMEITKYCEDQYVGEDFADINNRITSMIDNSKFIKMFADRSDKNVYFIDVDLPFEDERDGTDNFDGSKLVVSMIPHKITDIKNSDMINDVFKTYPHHHKIFVVDIIVDRAANALSRENNVEVFLKDHLTADLMTHRMAPHRCELDKGGANLYTIKPNISRILENDPLAKYFNAKVGDTLDIIRNTVTNGFERGRRKVIEPRPVFGK
jgi:DNA-directed RNA polymerase subunit H (RpoH/RPB5)